MALWPSFFNKERVIVHIQGREENDLEKEAKAGNEDTEERAVWSLCAVGGWKLLQVLKQGTDTFEVQLTSH